MRLLWYEWRVGYHDGPDGPAKPNSARDSTWYHGMLLLWLIPDETRTGIRCNVQQTVCTAYSRSTRSHPIHSILVRTLLLSIQTTDTNTPRSMRIRLYVD